MSETETRERGTLVEWTCRRQGSLEDYLSRQTKRWRCIFGFEPVKFRARVTDDSWSAATVVVYRCTRASASHRERETCTIILAIGARAYANADAHSPFYFSIPLRIGKVLNVCLRLRPAIPTRNTILWIWMEKRERKSPPNVEPTLTLPYSLLIVDNRPASLLRPRDDRTYVLVQTNLAKTWRFVNDLTHDISHWWMDAPFLRCDHKHSRRVPAINSQMSEHYRAKIEI